MAHTTEIVEFKKISNGQFSYLIRCCGDQSTDHWHTLGVNVADRIASLQVAREYVAAQHEKSLEITNEAATLAGQTVTHD